MTVFLKKAVFLHVPKTGGKWVREVIGRARNRRKPKGIDASPRQHETLDWFRSRPQFDGYFFFAFVRHPVEWLQSYYAYQTNKGEPGRLGIELPPTVEECFYQVAEQHPGAIRDLFWSFVGPPDAPIHFVGKQESLARDLRQVLDVLEVKCKSNIFSVARENTCERGPPPSKEAQAALMESEKEVCQRWGYQ